MNDWLPYATAIAGTFAIAMFGILLYRRAQERRAETDGVEMYVTPYVRKHSLLSAAELVFYARLQQAVGNELLVCPKVRLADVMDIRGDAIEWQAAWNRVAARHVDFLLVTHGDCRPLLAVELDNGSRRDDWVDKALTLAGLPVMRVRTGRDYDADALRREIEQRLAMR